MYIILSFIFIFSFHFKMKPSYPLVNYMLQVNEHFEPVMT